MRKLLIPASIAVGLLAAAAPAQKDVLATESFDAAPGPLGFTTGSGTGWANDWWSGASGFDALITTPGFDAVGNKATTNANDGGSYRLIDLSSAGPILDQGVLGKDGTTIWVRFIMERDPTSDDLYGGLSLSWQFVGEQLFLGSPYNTFELGLERPGSAAVTVPGTTPDLIQTLVYQVDFLPGDERVRMWIDPANNYPTVIPPDLDVMVPDLRFNEIRIQSGQGNMVGYNFDGIEIASDPFRPLLSVSNAVAGSLATIDVTNTTPGATVMIGYSLTGGGPFSTSFGTVSMSPPINQMPPQTSDPSGNVTLLASVPASMSGRTVWTQALELSPSGLLSNPVTVLVQ